MRWSIRIAPEGWGTPNSHAAAVRLALILGLCLTARLGEALPTVSGQYSLPGRSIFVEIVRDRIGVLSKFGTSDSAFTAAIDSIGFSVIERHLDGVYVVALGDTVSRVEAVDAARRIRATLRGVVANSGFVLVLPGMSLPNIVTDEFIVAFQGGVSQATMDSMNLANRVRVLEAHPAAGLQFVLQVPDTSMIDAMEMSKRYAASSLVRFAHPDFVRLVEPRGDPLLANQWPLSNGGQGGGTRDADLDVPEAWGVTRGAGMRVAVIDGGFDLTHEDLMANFWKNLAEASGSSNYDDDNNGYDDDIYGWNFYECDNLPDSHCGRSVNASPSVLWITSTTGVRTVPLPLDWHGTPVAGLIAAAKDNWLGGAGVCPECELMLLRRGNYERSQVKAFDYAWKNGADVISCSWGWPLGTAPSAALPAAVGRATTEGRLRPDRTRKGCVVVFAMSDEEKNDCDTANPDISARDDVIAVSASTNQDRKIPTSGYGPCTDLLASGHCGTQWITTTDIAGVEGYNSAHINSLVPNCPPPNTCPTPVPSLPTSGVTLENYYTCFMGTSAAAPLVSGAAALVLSVRPELSRAEVQRLLQDTADKIEPSMGLYDPKTGYASDPPGPITLPTHGFGRANAFEAVRIAAPAASGGKDGVDVFLRDNRLDWGNTEQPSNVTFESTRGFIPHWESPDIKIDAPASSGTPYQPAPTTSTQFDALVDERPIPGQLNKVYVRVRNRGPATAASVTVSLHWTQFGTALSPLPPTFWTANPWNSYDQTDWHPVDRKTISSLAYSGSTAARGWPGDPYDAAQIAPFDFTGPTHAPGTPNHYCLLATLDAAGDHPSPVTNPGPSNWTVDALTPSDNNITHRNIQVAELTTEWSQLFYVVNPARKPLWHLLTYEAPSGWKVVLKGAQFGQPFKMREGERKSFTVQIAPTSDGRPGDVRIVQERVDEGPHSKGPEYGNRVVVGGLTIRFVEPDRAESR